MPKRSRNSTCACAFCSRIWQTPCTRPTAWAWLRPQVGILKRAVVVDVGEGLIELVNPEIVSAEGEQSGPEGCLSVPGRSGIVVRPERVTVRAQNAHGEPIEVTGEGFLARAFCHEIDHLDGVLYVDKMVREIFPDEEEKDGGAETDGEEEGE